MSDKLKKPCATGACGCEAGGFYRTAPMARFTLVENRSGARELEPDAGLVVMAGDAPAVGHLVAEDDAEPAGLERVAVRALRRDAARAPLVADLDVRVLALGPGPEPDGLVLSQAGGTHAVRDELGDEEQQRRLLQRRHEAAARHRPARLAGGRGVCINRDVELDQFSHPLVNGCPPKAAR